MRERERKSCSNSTRQLFSNTLGSEQTLQFIAIMCQSLRLACTYLTKWFFFKSHQCYDFKKCVVYGLLSISQYFKSQHWIHDDMTRLWCLSDLQHTAQAGMERADSRQQTGVTWHREQRREQCHLLVWCSQCHTLQPSVLYSALHIASGN